MKSEYRFHIPENVLPIINNLVISNYSENCRVAYQYRYFYIVDYILRESTAHRKSVPLHSGRLSNILYINVKESSKMLWDLINAGIVEKVEDHEEGVSSARYTIPNDDFFQNIVGIQVSVEESPIVKKILRKKTQIDNGFLNSVVGLLYLDYLKSIEIDTKDFISLGVNLKTRSYILSGENRRLIRFDRTRDDVVRVADSDLFLKRPDMQSRVYCNISTLHRIHRKYLNVDGVGLKALDIGNSQILLAGVLIKDYCKKHNLTLPSEMNEYMEYCEARRFYELFMSEEEQNDKSFRDEFKKNFFGAVFFSRVSLKSNPIKDRFIEKFPNIYDIICMMKGGYVEGYDDPTYKKFAMALQALEAKIIFDNVNTSLLMDGYPCLNIYDSIVSHCTETLAEARKRLLVEFGRYGVRPTIILEDFQDY